MFTQDFICSYLVPVCGDQLAYEALSVEDFAKAVLEDKPHLIENDDYLDSIYRQIEEESNKGWVDANTYNVLTLSDWHIDLAYTVGTVKKDCHNFVCCH